ncbi:phosrestin-2, partial [Rhipicephalus microplus]|uniref:phosrestin-2 n=1 Tax=Rhipicephalus microplus TaxID=6941 RepID=UPI003F6A6988
NVIRFTSVVATAGVLNRSAGGSGTVQSATSCSQQQSSSVARLASAGPKLSRGGLCCVHEGATTDDEADDAARQSAAGRRPPPSQVKVARFHELRRQASASAKASPEQRKREASPPLCHVELRGRQVVKKSSPDSKVTLYMEKREFCDLGSCTEPVEGVVVLDADQLQPNERLLVALVGRFRYGREEDEILGMTLCREVYLGHTQLCHEQPSSPRTPQAATGSSAAEPPKSPGRALYAMQLGPVHRRLMDALGEAAVPFRFEFPRDAPVSTVMQRLTPESGDTCGVRYLVRCYTLLDEEETPAQSKSCVNIGIRKVQCATTPRPISAGPRSASLTKDFPLNAGKLVVEASLEKELYFHGEEVVVKINVQNHSQKTVKHIKVSILQVVDICMFSTGRWKVCVATANGSKDDCPVPPGSTVERRVSVTPSLEENRQKYGVFVESYKGDDVHCLASSTIISDHARRNLFGIVVSYEAKVKVYLGTLSSLSGRGEMACFVPFLLMHPRPAESPVDPSPDETLTATTSSSSAKLVPATDLEEVIAESSARTGAAVLQGPLESSPGGSVDVLGDSPTETATSAGSSCDDELVRKFDEVNTNSD